jgi:DNA polymerase III alpha subunit (gram-positive type)
MEYSIIGADCETDGLDPRKNSPIEVCFYKLNSDECRTWCLKTLTAPEDIQNEALKINGHKRGDILHLTASSKEKYLIPQDTLAEMENWLMEDGAATDQRMLLGHNIRFDHEMLSCLWRRCGSEGTFPFNTKYMIDTMTIEFSLDYASGKFGEGYSLRNLVKKYGLRNEKSHTAEADTKVMCSVFREQMKILKTIPTV